MKSRFESFDPRVRLLWMFVVATVAVTQREILPLLFVIVTLPPVWIFAQRFNYMALEKSKKLLPFLIFLAITQFFSAWIYEGSLNTTVFTRVLVQSLKVYTVITSSMLVFETTPSGEVAAAIRSFKRKKEGTWNKVVESSAFCLATAFQFIPIIQREISQIILVRRMRGEGVLEGNQLQQAAKMLRMGIPLISRVFEVTRNFMLTIINFGYSPLRVRTQFKKLCYNRADWVATVTLLIGTVPFFFV